MLCALCFVLGALYFVVRTLCFVLCASCFGLRTFAFGRCHFFAPEERHIYSPRSIKQMRSVGAPYVAPDPTHGAPTERTSTTRHSYKYVAPPERRNDNAQKQKSEVRSPKHQSTKAPKHEVQNTKHQAQIPRHLLLQRVHKINLLFRHVAIQTLTRLLTKLYFRSCSVDQQKFPIAGNRIKS